MPNEQTEIQVCGQPPISISTTAPKSEISHLIAVAIESGKSPEFLRELLSVRREWEADEARKAYAQAITTFQERCPIIQKLDKAYNNAYARMDRIWRETRELRRESGITVSWLIAEMRDGLCHVEGQLRHVSGHVERMACDVPIPELIKGQNKAQQGGSAITYAQRYAFCGALGIVTSDRSDQDDDGNNAGSIFVTQEQGEELSDMIDVCRGIDSFSIEKFWQFAGAKDSAFQIKADRYTDVKRLLQVKMKGVRQDV